MADTRARRGWAAVDDDDELRTSPTPSSHRRRRPAACRGTCKACPCSHEIVSTPMSTSVLCSCSHGHACVCCAPPRASRRALPRARAPEQRRSGWRFERRLEAHLSWRMASEWPHVAPASSTDMPSPRPRRLPMACTCFVSSDRGILAHVLPSKHCEARSEREHSCQHGGDGLGMERARLGSASAFREARDWQCSPALTAASSSERCRSLSSKPPPLPSSPP